MCIAHEAHVVYLDGISANEKPLGKWVSLILGEFDWIQADIVSPTEMTDFA